MAFSSSGNSDDFVVSIPTDFPSKSKPDASFHHITCDYSCVDWGSLLRDVPWEDIFKPSPSAASEF